MHLKRSKLPHHAKPQYRHKPTTTNGMTKCVIDYINYSGHQAERISTSGRWVGGKTFTDVIGRTRELKGNWIPGSGVRGSADIAATKKLQIPRSNGVRIVGQKVAIEVKSKNDRQSDHQKKYQKHIEDSGGIYIIAKVGNEGFEQFVEAWNRI